MNEFKRRGNTNCSVVSCNNTYTNTNSAIQFYGFPKKPHLKKRREKWTITFFIHYISISITLK